MSDLISVIIVNWNGRKWLQRCLDSLGSQTHLNREIILVDNASSDGSAAFVREFYPDTVLVANPTNRGYAGGVNIGIERARGHLILLINNDTWIEKDFLHKLLAFYKSGGYDVVAPAEAMYDGRKRSPYVTQIDFLAHPVPFLAARHISNTADFYLAGTCLLFSREVYSVTGGFDDRFFMYFEEADWFWRLNLFNKKFAYARAIYIYHFGAGSTGKGIKQLSFLWRNQNTLRMLLKNYSQPQLFWLLPLYLLQNLVEIVFFMLVLKPKIALSYVQGWLHNLSHREDIMRKRAWVQRNRLVRDGQIMRKKMYFGLGKIRHLIDYFRRWTDGVKTSGDIKTT